MSLAGIQTSNILPFSEQQQFFHQRGQDLRQLGQALNNGDLAGAQQAYSSLLQLAQQNGGTNSTDTDATAALFRNPRIASDFAAVGQALQSGDLAGAQQAFATFRQDLRSGRQQQNGQQAANNALPEIVINLSGILPSNPGTSQSGATNSSDNNTPTASTTASPGTSTSSSSSATSTTGQPATSAPEIVLNLFGGNGSFAGPEIIFNFGGNSASSSAPAPAPSEQTASGNSPNSQNQEIVFNLANSGVSEIDFNLGGSNPGLVLKFAPQQNSNGNLNVVA